MEMQTKYIDRVILFAYKVIVQHDATDLDYTIEGRIPPEMYLSGRDSYWEHHFAADVREHVLNDVNVCADSFDDEDNDSLMLYTISKVREALCELTGNDQFTVSEIIGSAHRRMPSNGFYIFTSTGHESLGMWADDQQDAITELNCWLGRIAQEYEIDIDLLKAQWQSVPAFALVTEE